jgi:Fe-S-cluster containining protein
MTEAANDEQPQETPPKFKFECTRCGECCKIETVPVYISDLENWVKDQTIFRVLHVLDLEVSEEQTRIILKKDEDGYCKLYHRDNKACSINYNKPLYCKSYPLGYNGSNYIVKNKECPGLKAEKMSPESLREMRDDAFADYIAARQVKQVLPLLQTIFYNKLLEESQKAMERMQEPPDEESEKDIE